MCEEDGVSETKKEVKSEGDKERGEVGQVEEKTGELD